MRALRILGSAVLVGVLYAASALATYRFLNAPDAGASFFPAAGISLAALLSTPRPRWPFLLAAVAIAEVSIDLFHSHLGVLLALGYATANVVEPLVGATLVGVFARHRHPAPGGYLIWYVLGAVVCGPFVGGVIGALATTLWSSFSGGSGHFVSTAAEWWLGDGLGVLLVATPLLAWKRRAFYDTPASLGENIGIAVAAAVVVVVPGVFLHESYAFAVLPVLMLAAIRGGPFGVSLSGIGVGFGASWIVASGHANALLTARGAEAGLVDTQLFIGVTILSALVLAVAVAERTRVERVLRQTEIARSDAEMIALQAAVGERRRIARETHDIVGHALNVIILSTAAARRVLDRDPPQARELLTTVEDVGRDAFRDLDVALGLTDRSPDLAPPKGLADLDELVARLVQAGMPVEYEVEGRPRPLPRLVDGSAYRIIQESLTNVARHAAGARGQVHVRFAPDALFLEVFDEGGPAPKKNGNGNGNGGRGLMGMRERVAVLGGRIVAGPVGNGGYSVEAELPLEHELPQGQV